ncbi:DnaJ domain-containing protein [Humitalea sp. 24SJ18S-53]|uniref:DnaJ domain-containing protein n=1 Tax=Humitalea sp. 24SJ18S-53 TaxID=3422307 RepID=UPI003D66BC77
MAWLALGGVGLIAVLLLLRGFANAPPAAVRRGGAWLLGGLGLAIALLLIVSGRAGQAFGALVLFGPLVLRWYRSWQQARTFATGGRAHAGGVSTVETATLTMTLDHDSGTMTGAISRGDHAGQSLADLALPQVLALLADCQASDPESVPLLEAWLDRADPDWRDQPQPPRAAGGAMDRTEALAILGLPDNATPEQIKAAHRRLMAQAHPDRGGSDWLAARINQARDLLLGD